MKHMSVLIPDGNNHRALKVVRSLACSEYMKIYIIADKNRNVHFSKHCKAFILPEKDDDKNVYLKQIIDISKKYHIDTLLPISEAGIKFVILHKDILKEYYNIAPIPDDKFFETARNKGLFHDFAVEHHLPVPKAVHTADFFTDSSAIKDLSFPVLLKPVIGEGGQGIQYVESEKQFRQIFDVKTSQNHYDNYLIQEYIMGKDTDLSVLCKNGEILAYTIQIPVVKHAGAFSFGKIIRFIEHNDILETGRKLLSDLQWNGIAHIDFLVEEKNAVARIIDINPRFWGSLYGSVSAGVNFPYLACLAAEGIFFSLPSYDKTVYAELSNKEKLHLLLGRKQNHNITLKQTDFKYTRNDPFQSLKEFITLFNLNK